ncbi:MAG TPA: ABC transporter permease [Acidimicrobiia bacterium]|nr:ABC transporter permease [Acidimicrobiia bacterium]
MVTIATPASRPTASRPLAPTSPRSARALSTLVRRRFALSVRTPRELLVPLLTPVLFALVIAPALADQVTNVGGIDYMSFVAIATVGLLLPLSCMSAGIGVLVDRESGARRDLIAAPLRRPLIVFGNLTVALAVSALQLAVLIGAAVLRGAQFSSGSTGIMWFVAASLGLVVIMYGAAETLANRIPTQEEYVAALPAVAIVPWFFAGSLFPVNALPAGLAAFAKVLPLTHVLAVMRYGLVDHRGTGLHDIWGMSSPTAMALLSLAVVAAYAVLLTVVAVRVFNRATVQ